MVIYNVTSNMAAHIAPVWLEWVRTHIAHVLGTGLFMDARLTEVLIEDPDGSKTYAVQYKASSREALETYYTNHADALRKEGLQKFGDSVLSFRTELDLIDEYMVHGSLN